MLKISVALVCIACGSDARRDTVDERGALASLLLEHKSAAAFKPSGLGVGSIASNSHSQRLSDVTATLSRRALLGSAAALLPSAALARKAKYVDESVEIGSLSGGVMSKLAAPLEELTPPAKKALLQYFGQLQQSTDYFVFELFDKISTPERWDVFVKFVKTKNAASAADPSPMDRNFVVPMRAIALGYPPDEGGNELLKAVDDFQKAMYSLAKYANAQSTIGNVDVPDKDSIEVKTVASKWVQARNALNIFLDGINKSTGGYQALTLIPAKVADYEKLRSKDLYFQLLKDNALCRNRGGETLANIYSYLMVYGTVPGVKPCGYAAEKYFAQNRI